MTDYEIIVLAVRHNIHGETTDAQAIAFAQEIRRAALEEAAKVCDQMVSVSAISYETGSACAAAIRALSQHKKGEP
jgi:hypothetical protein